MKRVIILVLTLITLIIAACGKRTPPTPILEDVFSNKLPVIQNEKLNFSGDNLVFHWELSDVTILGDATGDQLPSAETTGDSLGATSVSTTPTANLSVPPVNALAVSADTTSDQTEPESESTDRLSVFLIHVQKLAGGCNACLADEIGVFVIDGVTGKSGFQTNDEDLSNEYINVDALAENLQFTRISKDGFEVIIPVDTFYERFYAENCFFTINYKMTSGMNSFSSRQLIPSKPLSIPVPRIRLKKLIQIQEKPSDDKPESVLWKSFEDLIGLAETSAESYDQNPPDQNTKQSDGYDGLPLLPGTTFRENADEVTFDVQTVYDPFAESCRKPDVAYFLIIQWQPVQEVILHIIDEAGKVRELTKYYGINLYTEPTDSKKAEASPPLPPSKGNQLRLLNDKPLSQGSFALSDFHDLLYARNVDRYGNESEQILVFDGNYY